MELEFKPRDHHADDENVYDLPRVLADSHPLSATPQVEIAPRIKECETGFDPLWGIDERLDIASAHSEEEERSTRRVSSKEWSSLKNTLMQKFPVAKSITLSSISQGVMKAGKVQKFAVTEMLEVEELDDPNKTIEGLKFMSQKDYVSRMHELKCKISDSWNKNDRVTSLKLSIKVARLLMDTSVLQFYPTLFVLATGVMDMLGDMVWERIREKVEHAEDGTFVCSLPDTFETSNICDDAKETCINWFSKIGSIRELLPRLYLELALLPCWRFLTDNPMSSLQRLVSMTRGIGDPLASAYCRLYAVYRAQKLPQHDIGYLLTGIFDMKIQMVHIVALQDTKYGISLADKRLLVSLMEPTIEYMTKFIFKDLNEVQVQEVLTGLGLGKDHSHVFGDHSSVSIILHHLLKELPIDIICSNAMSILHVIECDIDWSFEQFLNYKLLGLRLCERIPQVSEAIPLVEKVTEVISCGSSLDEYLTVSCAFVDIILQNQMDRYLNKILDEIFDRVCTQEIGENALSGLQSFFLKLLTHFDDVEEIVLLNHFIDILDVMTGSSRNIININILKMATKKTCIQDPSIIHFLFEVSQTLHDGLDYSNIRSDESQQSARLISCFVNMVDYEADVENHLSFLLDCRGAFSGMSDLKETFVHSSNLLAIKALKYGSNPISFVKSCLTFSEVTIPSVPACLRQMSLYLETAEIALQCELVSHANGLIDSVLCCLQEFNLMDGLQTPSDVDACLCGLWRFCNLALRVPGGLKQGLTYGPKNVYSFLDSAWMTSNFKIRGYCALISMLAALSRNPLQIHPKIAKVMDNHQLIFNDPIYSEEISSFADEVVDKVFDILSQEPLQATRGNLALEFYNCIVSSFKVLGKRQIACTKLLQIAELSLGSNHLVSTKNFIIK